jgi:16S rRNA (cytidine1402-2'-O)-methyltransferase
MAESGRLILISTPLGNLGEFPSRAVEVLKGANRIYCENTPKALKLFNYFAIEGKGLRVIHEANEAQSSERVALEVAGGAVVAYLSEAGVPGICDPGFRLVRECRKRGLRVEAVGVPSAFLNAIVISGLPTDSFAFGGFPPPKSVGRGKFFAQYCQGESTFVFYESCHRLLKSMEDLRSVVGENRFVCLAGELTKLHESVQTAPLGEIKLPADPKGEWVVCVAKKGYML